jgi:uncharacterized membrane protein
MEKQIETQGEKETGRLEAFSDGVFAIAITLLVLELKVPALSPAGATSAALGKSLLQLWPSYLALITSFFTVLIMWMHHHAILRNVHRTDSWLHFTNGCLLLVISFVPYPTSVLAAYLETPAAKMAAAFYSGTFILVALCFSLFVYGAFRPKLLARHASQRYIETTLRNYRLGPPIYFLATAAALIDARLSLGICTALWIFWAAVTSGGRAD